MLCTAHQMRRHALSAHSRMFHICDAKLGDNQGGSNNLPDSLTLTGKTVLLVISLFCFIDNGKEIRLRILQGRSDARMVG